MVEINADNLPWVLIGVLVTGMLATFYAMLRGAIIPRRVAEQLRESAERRAEVAEAGVTANTETNKTLAEQVTKLMVLAENQDKILKALGERAARGNTHRRGDTS